MKSLALPSLIPDHQINTYHNPTAVDLRSITAESGYLEQALFAAASLAQISVYLIFHTAEGTCDDVANLYIFKPISGQPAVAFKRLTVHDVEQTVFSLSDFCPDIFTSANVSSHLMKYDSRIVILRIEGPTPSAPISLLIYGSDDGPLPIPIVGRERRQVALPSYETLGVATQDRGAAWLAVFINEVVDKCSIRIFDIILEYAY